MIDVARLTDDQRSALAAYQQNETGSLYADAIGALLGAAPAAVGYDDAYDAFVTKPSIATASAYLSAARANALEDEVEPDVNAYLAPIVQRAVAFAPVPAPDERAAPSEQQPVLAPNQDVAPAGDPAPFGATTLTGDGWLVTVVDRAPRAGETGWWASWELDRASRRVDVVLAEILRDVVVGRGTTSTAGPGGFGWLSDADKATDPSNPFGWCLTVVATREDELEPVGASTLGMTAVRRSAPGAVPHACRPSDVSGSALVAAAIEAMNGAAVCEFAELAMLAIDQAGASLRDQRKVERVLRACGLLAETGGAS